ncbi:MAG: HU family DNA-binding protein [Planctomycetota bacterium]
MTKKEIVRSISDELGLPQQQVKLIVQKLFSELIDTLAEDGRIELRNFGVFEVKVRAARSARNPKTGEQMPIPARSVVTFKPGKEMEEQVQQAAARKERLAKLANPASENSAPPKTIPPTAPEKSP